MGDIPMRSTESSSRSRRGTPRRLSSHVLTPLAAAGLVAVIGASAAVTVSQREAAIHSLDARAAAVRDLGRSALKQSGSIEPLKELGGGVKLRLLRADRPLPGGRSVKT